VRTIFHGRALQCCSSPAKITALEKRRTDGGSENKIAGSGIMTAPRSRLMVLFYCISEGGALSVGYPTSARNQNPTSGDLMEEQRKHAILLG